MNISRRYREVVRPELECLRSAANVSRRIRKLRRESAESIRQAVAMTMGGSQTMKIAGIEKYVVGRQPCPSMMSYRWPCTMVCSAMKRRGSQMHSTASNHCLCRLSRSVGILILGDETCSMCMQRQRHATGRAKLTSIITLVEISHQTMPTTLTLSPHTAALTPYITFVVNSQAITERVAMFPARQCHGSERRRESAARKATGGNSG